MYVSGQGILERHGIEDYKKRQQIRDAILTSDNTKLVKQILTGNNIGLLYFYGKPDLSKTLKEIKMKKIFENKDVTVFHFQPE